MVGDGGDEADPIAAQNRHERDLRHGPYQLRVGGAL